MRGRWTALGLALVLSLTLTSCGAKTGTGTAAGRLSSQGTSGTETPARRSRNLMEDGRYYAGANGEVKRRSTGESEWEKLGRELRESWDKMMDGAEDAARDTERAAGDAVRGTERAVKDGARDVDHGM